MYTLRLYRDGIQAAAVAYQKAVEAHPTHASILCKYGSFVKHVENDHDKVNGKTGLRKISPL